MAIPRLRLERYQQTYYEAAAWLMNINKIILVKLCILFDFFVFGIFFGIQQSPRAVP
jgi:hypothetical protein